MRLASSRAIVVVGLSVILLASPSALAQSKAVCARNANEAQTLKDAGKYLDARAALAACSGDSCPTVVRDACREWLSKLDTEMPTVVFAARDANGLDLVDVRVLLDGTALLERLTGTAVPIDPGEHVLRFEASGLAPTEQRVVLRVNEKDRVIPATLTRPKVETPPTQPPVPHGDHRPIPPSPWRTVTGVGLGVAAVAAVGTGAYFAAKSRSDSRTATAARQEVGSASACTSSTSNACTGLRDDVNAKYRDANTSVGLFVAAAALAVGALAAWFLWPTDGGSTPTMAPHAAEPTWSF